MFSRCSRLTFVANYHDTWLSTKKKKKLIFRPLLEVLLLWGVQYRCVNLYQEKGFFWEGLKSKFSNREGLSTWRGVYVVENFRFQGIFTNISRNRVLWVLLQGDVLALAYFRFVKTSPAEIASIEVQVLSKYFPNRHVNQFIGNRLFCDRWRVWLVRLSFEAVVETPWFRSRRVLVNVQKSRVESQETVELHKNSF